MADVRPPRAWASVEAYEADVRAAIARSDAFDERSVYLMARLSPRYPTIEIRVADTCLTVADTVLLAGLCRALVGAIVRDIGHGRPDAPVQEVALRSALTEVARDGLPSSSAPPDTARTMLVTELLRALVPGTRDSREADLIGSGIERLSRLGTGAVRQRRAWERARSTASFVTAMRESTVSDEAIP